ncbi:MAG: hypothetical protein JWO30_601 [Fibrobacteres bacterium]|nr:hypothetical protein [Fibrobacterota bacterium]
MNRMFWKSSLILSLGALFIACWQNVGEKTTSTSITTGNPTKIGLVFIEQNSADTRVHISGSLGIFAANQVPVLDSLPYLTIKLVNQDTFNLSTGAIEDLIGSHLYDTTFIMPDDSIASFNILVQSREGAAVIRGLKYNYDKKYFQGTAPPPGADFHVYMQRTVPFGGSIKIPEELLAIERYDFYACIPGTPFYSKLDKMGAFSMQVPKGKYEGRFVVIQVEGLLSGIAWKAKIFGVSDSLYTEKNDAYMPSEVIDSVYAK